MKELTVACGIKSGPVCPPHPCGGYKQDGFINIFQGFPNLKELKMAKKRFPIGWLATAAVFAMLVAGCDTGTNGGGGNTVPKVLVITGLDPTQQQSTSLMVGIFPAGTPLQQAAAQTGIVAGATSASGNVTVSGNTATIELYAAPGYNSKWTDSGTYDIYLSVGNNYYRSQNVAFVSATTQVATTSFSPANP
jgi:hypothetical protein